jgi:hypothetical protein
VSRWYSEAKPRDEKKKTTVRIRHFGYDRDYELAKRLRALIAEHIRWDVTLDGSNNPSLEKAEDG